MLPGHHLHAELPKILGLAAVQHPSGQAAGQARPGQRGGLLLLGISFLQQAGPKLLVVVVRMHKEVLLIQDR